jgi:hypothetical protein
MRPPANKEMQLTTPKACHALWGNHPVPCGKVSDTALLLNLAHLPRLPNIKLVGRNMGLPEIQQDLLELGLRLWDQTLVFEVEPVLETEQTIPEKRDAIPHLLCFW